MRLLVFGLAMVMLAACGRPGESGDGGPVLNAQLIKPSAAFHDAESAATEAAAASADAAAAPSGGAGQPSPVQISIPQLAYRYDYGVEAPAKGIRGLVSRHEEACLKAGPRLCQVTRSGVRELGKDRLSASLEFRAEPGWLKRFRDGLAGDAEAAGGRVNRAEVDSEDLSRQIVDTEARLRAMTTLRDRLQALLATRPGKLSDLVEIERELARVQGDIDSMQSQLTVMRGRVAMSEVTIRYTSAGVLAPQGVWSPLGKAFTDFLGIVVFTVAAMVRLIAWLLPWVLLGAGLWWLLRKRLPAPRWPFGRKRAADT
jgi:hypothetical protein